MTIHSKAATNEYRDGWDRIFKKPECDHTYTRYDREHDTLYCRDCHARYDPLLQLWVTPR